MDDQTYNLASEAIQQAPYVAVALGVFFWSISSAVKGVAKWGRKSEIIDSEAAREKAGGEAEAARIRAIGDVMAQPGYKDALSLRKQMADEQIGAYRAGSDREDGIFPDSKELKNTLDATFGPLIEI